MTITYGLMGGLALLGFGTWLMRFSGALLGNKMTFSDHARSLLSDGATTLLFAVAMSCTFYEGVSFAGYARVAGVAVAVLFAWRKAPLIAVIAVAALVTGLLRYVGVH